MKLRVVKMGSDMFDGLHAYGLGIVMAYASGASVDLCDEGASYVLSIPSDVQPARMADILAVALKLPEVDDVLAPDQSASQRNAAANMDGLLAAGYTTPGIRGVSLADLAARHNQFPSCVQDALTKVRAALARWTKDATRQTRWSTGRMDDVLRDYDVDHPAIPLPTAITKMSYPSIPMGIDPSFSFSSRRPHSDGFVARKTKVRVGGTRYALALAVVGAARLLRAQCVSGNLVNMYLPLADHMMVECDTTLPPSAPVEHTSRHAIVCQWLAYAHHIDACDACWNDLAYQVLQSQGVQSPISLGRGRIDLLWLAAIEPRGEGREGRLRDHWRSLLTLDDAHRPYDMGSLLDCLLDRRADSWMTHLRDITMRRVRDEILAYTLDEVKGVTAAMIGSAIVPLSDILRRPEGTLRFGRALRQLGMYNSSALRDVVDDLDSVSTRDHLVRALAGAVQRCAVASAKTPFMIIPSDTDLEDLLDDIDRHGVRTVASILIILSSLRYPRASDDELNTAPPIQQEPISTGTNAVSVDDDIPQAANHPRSGAEERA